MYYVLCEIEVKEEEYQNNNKKVISTNLSFRG